MATERLQHQRYKQYVAAWDPKTSGWWIDFAQNLMKVDSYRRVIDVPQLDNQNGEIEARFAALDPSLSDDKAAAYAAHAILDFFWPDAEEEGDVKRIVMHSVATGVRYEFEGPQ